MNLLETFVQARKKSVPLIAWISPDAAASVRNISTVTNGSPLIVWDIVRGMQGLNEPGRNAVSDVLQGADASMRANPVESLMLAQAFPIKSVLFMLNAQRILSEYAVIQAIWNLRDSNASNGRTCILLSPGLTLPPELANDVMVLNEPLPDDAEIQAILAKSHTDAALDVPESLDRAIDAVRGIAAFPTSQAAAMSLSRAGLDVDGLWERKRQTIETTKGLSVWRGAETFANVAGNANVIKFMRAVFAGNDAPRSITFIDEIEKSAIAAGAGDLTGTGADYLGQLLSHMQDTNASGVIFVGPPGSGKSLVAQTAGNTAGIPTVQMDLGGMKASLVGESETNLRTALKVLTAVSQGRNMFIATCNSIAALPPELRRRFRFGTFYFDLMTKVERDAAWTLFLAKFSIPEQPLPPCEGWTGAEIRQCCDLAYRLRITLVEASAYIVPVCKSAASQIEQLRTQASGKFISASYSGVYRYEPSATTGGRMLEV